MALVPSQLLLEGYAFQRYGTYSDISGYGFHFASVMFACVRAFSLMTRIPPVPQLKGCSRVGSPGITGSLPRYNPMVIYQTPLPHLQPYMQYLRLPKPACSGACNQVVFLALHAGLGCLCSCIQHLSFAGTTVNTPTPEGRQVGPLSSDFVSGPSGVLLPRIYVLLIFTVLCLLDPYLKISSNTA